MMVAGGFIPASMPGSSDRVPTMVCWSGRVAQRTAIAGVSGERPLAISWREISGNVVSPMKITSVSAWPTLAQSIACAECPVTKVTAEVCSRWVRGTPV